MAPFYLHRRQRALAVGTSWSALRGVPRTGQHLGAVIRLGCPSRQNFRAIAAAAAELSAGGFISPPFLLPRNQTLAGFDGTLRELRAQDGRV